MVRLPDGLRERLDETRGDVPLNTAVVRAIEQYVDVADLVAEVENDLGAPPHHDRQRDRYSPKGEATEAGVTSGKKSKGGGVSAKVGGAPGFNDLGKRDVTPQFKKAAK